MAPPDSEARPEAAPVERLRLGLLLDTLAQPAWVERALRRVIETGRAEFVLVVRNAAPAGPRRRLLAWWRGADQLLYGLFQRLDRARGLEPDPFAPVDLSAMLRGVPVIDVSPRQSRVSDVIEEADLERIRRERPDVLVRLGFRILRGGILNAAPHGVWSYHHGDNHRYRGGPPAFWEVIEGNPVTGTLLQRLTEWLDDGEVLYRSWGATNLHSVARTQGEIYWKSSEFLARAVLRLAEGRDEASAPRDPVPYGHRLYVAPRNREMAAGMARLLGRRVRSKWASLTTHDQWFLAFRRRADLAPSNREPDLAPFRFTPIYPPRDRYWADPFPMRAGGADYVLFEDYPYATRRGVIAALELGAGGPVGSPQVILERDYHLSYPFVFEWKGVTFLMPETADAHRLEVYRATRPPMEWTLEAVPIEGVRVADATLAEIGGRWWMFTNQAVPGASFWDELFLYHGPTPLGPWTPHRRNPIVSDVRRARPAGGLFQRGGHWYRPSQDCSARYGGAVNIHRIVRLDESSYEECTVGRLLPDWRPGLHGVHTVNALGGLTVLDALRRRSRLSWAT
ncbi:MAG: hypothetical protein HUU26_01595 [Gemmatimonadaceae bacterium]|nr:hypothetical protein [Gemmatimonadaceae bacterium]